MTDLATRIQRHEARHIFADAIGLAALGRKEEYETSNVYLTIKSNEGSVVTLVTDEDHVLNKQIARLGAFGPLANIQTDKLLSLIASNDEQAMVELSGVSDTDLSLMKQWQGPPALPIVVVLGVKELERQLGKAGFASFAHTLATISNQKLSPISIHALVPYDHAKAALAVGRQQVSQVCTTNAIAEAAQ